MGFVCAFRGRRDSYQVPIALAEAGLLDQFVTDQYSSKAERVLGNVLPRRLGESVLARFDPALPQSLVRRLHVTAVQESIARFAGRPAAAIYERFDPRYGDVAARCARQYKSDLFMYSPYAWSAFNASYRHSPRRVLFQFHPHHMLESSILRADSSANERSGIYFDGQMETIHQAGATARVHGDSAWQLADHIVCASQFTRRSLIAVGARPERISVVPYGVTSDTSFDDLECSTPDEGFHVLFVGSGIQRKGLHHLLLAWNRARLPVGARLTVVARVIDPGLEPLLAATPRVIIRRGVPQAELRRLYATATLFCMPSLIEGFGQVYLEALASGLPVLGTTHTCCPDLGTPADGVFITTPGNIDELIASLETLARRLPGDCVLRTQARACAMRYTWSAFRRQIQATVNVS